MDFAKNIENLVTTNRTVEALDAILENEKYKKHFDLCNRLKTQFNELKEDRQTNLISYDEYKQEKAKITDAILDIKKEIEIQTKTTSLSQNPNPTKAENKLNGYEKPSKLFTGREDKLKEVEKAFKENDIFTLTGIGGFGKTELIAKFISDFKESKKEKITWLDFSTEANFDSFIVGSGFGDILQANKTDTDKIRALKDKINEDQRIVIWDNFHDNKHKLFSDFIEFAKGKLNNSKLIIISRTNENLNKCNLKNIELTEFKESYEFANKLLEDRYSNSNLKDEEIKEICKYVGGHPLAIKLTFDLCNSVPYEKVIGKLHKFKRNVDELSQRLFEEILAQESTSKEEKEFLYQFSVFKEKVSEKTIENIFEEDCFYEIVPSLKDKYLIDFKQETKTYNTHPLIREFCYDKLETKKELHEKVANYYIKERSEKLNILEEERIFHHLKAAENYNEIAQTIEKYGRDYKIKTFFDLLKEMISLLNEKNIETPLHHLLLGSIYEIRGDWNKAFEYFEKAKNNTINEELAVEGLLNYGDIYRKKGEINDALKIFQEAEKISIEKDFQKYIAWSYNNIAVIKDSLGNLNEALDLYKKALVISERLNIKEDIASLYNNIGSIYGNEKFKGFSLNKELEYHNKSLNIRLEIGDKSGIATSYNNIGLIYGQLKKYKEQLINYFKTHTILKQIQAKNNLETTENNIIITKQYLGKEKFLKYANLAIQELEPEYQKEIDLSEFSPQPQKAEKKYANNEKVKVEYPNGEIKEGKFKKFKFDYENDKCKIVE